MSLDSKYDYIEEGAGSPIIMLHGMFGELSNWAPVVKTLSKSYRTIVLGLPYLELEPKLCSVRVMTEFLARFIDQKRLRDVTLIGNSLGGHIALDYAINHKEPIRNLVLTGSSGLFERGYADDVQIHPTREYLTRKIGEVFYDKSFVSDRLIESAYNQLKSRMLKLKIIRMSKSAKRYNLSGQLSLITCDTLLIWGKNDIITPSEVAHIFNANIRNSKLVFINGCGHAPMIEKPDEFNRHLTDFLKNSDNAKKHS
ncbi:MAG: alpha/beta hydrolase [Candidatus Omnitrophica bacterium]|nr:alpha/beta hydrolase [Candidatus Omnitrophota bacterium]